MFTQPRLAIAPWHSRVEDAIAGGQEEVKMAL
jgi:hypothetical protein